MRIEGFEGALSSRATIDELTIADDEGVWLTLRDAVLDWNRSALLRRRIEVSELSADEILLPRLPAAQQTGPQAPSPEAQGFSLPELPVSIRIDLIEADRVLLGEPLFGEQAEVSLRGEVSLEGGEGAADISAERIDGEEGALTLQGAYSNETRELTLDLSLREGPDGIVANLADLPGRPSLALTVDGSGPVSDFAADITLATDGEERLAGQVAVTGGAAEGEPLRFDAEIGGDVAPVFLPEYREFFGPDMRLATQGARYPDGRLELTELSLAARALQLQGRSLSAPTACPTWSTSRGGSRARTARPCCCRSRGRAPASAGRRWTCNFDASQGEDWQALVEVEGLDREGFAAEAITLDGSGRIGTEAGADGDLRVVTAELDFAARALDFGDPGAAQALGQNVTGLAEITWIEGSPVEIGALELTGETYGLTGAATIGFDSGVTVDGSATLAARDLSAFSGLAGRPLGGRAQLTLEGSGDVLAGAFDLSADGTTENLSVGIERLDPLLDGSGELVLRTARDETGTAIERFRVATDALEAEAQGRLATGASQLTLNASVDDTARLADGLAGPASLTLDATEDPEGWDMDLAVTAPGADVAAKGRLTGLGEAPEFAGDLTARVEDLAAYADLAGRPLAGSVDLSAQGRTGFDLAQADLTLNATGEDLALGLPQVDPLLDGTTTIALDLARDGDVVRIDGARLDGPVVDATVDGQLEGLSPSGAFEGRVTLDAADLAPFSALAGRDLAGAAEVEAEGRVRFDASFFDLTATARTTDLEPGVPGLAELLPGETVLTLDAARDADDVIIDALTLDGQRVDADIAGRLTGVGALLPPGSGDEAPVPAFDGRATVEVATLAPLSRLAGRDLAGALRVEALGSAAFDGSRFDLKADAVATDLDPGMAGAADALAGRMTVTADAARTGDTVEIRALRVDGPQLAAEVDGTLAGLDGVPVFDGNATVEAGDLSIFSGLAGRDLAGALDAQVAGRVGADLATLDLEADATGRGLDFGLPGSEALLAGEARLALDAAREGDAIRLDQLSLDSANLNLSASGRVEGLDAVPAFEGEAALSADDLAPFSALAGRSLSGGVEAQANGRIVTDLSAFDGTLNATGRRLRIGLPDVDRLLGETATLSVDAERNGALTIRTLELDTAGLDVTASGQLDQEITLRARLADVSPYAPGLSGPVTVDGTAALVADAISLNLNADGPGDITASVRGIVQTPLDVVDLTLEGRAPLVLANRFISPRSVAGTAVFDLALRGAPALSNLSGTISTQDARFVAPRFGIVVENIDATARLADARLTLNAGADVQGGGTLSADGTLGLTNGLRSDLGITLDQVHLRNPELYDTRVDGSLSIVGPLRGGARIGGELALGRTELRIGGGGLGAGGDIPDIIHVNEPAAVHATRERAGVLRRNPSDGGQQGPAFPLDILIRAENQIFVRGRGLDAELGGQLRLGGTSRDVQPAGRFELIRGRLDILGERLVLDEGSIRLEGDFVPVIRLVARTETGGITVLVVVEGSVREPDINFLSEPELPEDEVLARLLFGRDISQISAFQAAQLASAVATLTGRGNGLISNLRENFGLDDLDVTTDETGGAALRAGKYLSDNLYTDVTVNSEGETEINLNFDLSDRVTVKGGISDDGHSSLGIFYERDY